MNFKDLPEYVERNVILEFFSKLGIDPKSLAQIHFNWEGIKVSFYAEDIKGKRYWDKSTDSDPAINVVHIPMKDLIEFDNE